MFVAKRCALIFTALGTLAGPALAQAPIAASPDRHLFTWEDAALGASFVVGTFAIRPLDKTAARALQRPDRQTRSFYRRSASFVRTVAQPGSTLIGLSMYGAGRLTSNDRLAAVGLHGTEALFLGAAVGTVMKDFFGRARPFVDTTGPNPDDWQIGRGWDRGDRYQSFPSGHTTAAFAAAGAVTAETSAYWPGATYFLIGPVLYTGAALVGVSRMYNNRHWASDVIMGAAIGTFAGMKVVRYSHIHPNNKPDQWLLNTNWVPCTGQVAFSIIPALGRFSSAKR
ncbi:MAG TPA: phosphatase PAP2 family protein [Gemmatimonadaceae bacterium]|jgi:membrane-associated phospholipid phosphatase